MGIGYIALYCNNNNINYPDWFHAKFIDIPRYNPNMMNYDSGLSSTVIVDYDDFAKKVFYVMDYLKGGWAINSTFHFELEEDAVAFKLRWS